MKNVIFLIIDSLRWDRLGFAGHTPSPSPTIDRLMASGLCLTNCFAVGCPTDFALPGLATSTQPLDKGGYSMGIKTREITLAEVMKMAGYKTVAFIQDTWQSSWGYRRGYDDYFFVHDLARYYLDATQSIRFYKELCQAAPEAEEVYLARFESYLDVLFKDIREYCRIMVDQLARTAMPISLKIHGYNFPEVDEITRAAESEFMSDKKKFTKGLLGKGEPTKYFAALLKILEFPYGKRGGKYSLYRLLRGLVFRSLLTFYGKRGKDSLYRLLRGLVFRSLLTLYISAMLKHVNVNEGSFSRGLDMLRHPYSNLVRGASGAYILNNLFYWLDKAKGKPFFAWVHLLDVHELNFCSYDLPNSRTIVEEEVRSLKKLHRKMASRLLWYRGNPLYDLAIHYSDMQVGRLVEYLKQRGLWSDTLIVLTADHGHTNAAWPIRDGSVHVSSHFYDELYCVPAAFIGKGIQPRKMDNICSSIDIAPTLLDLLGIPVPKYFRGLPVGQYVPNDDSYVEIEHMGSGLFDFLAKPIYVCVRSNHYKLIYLMPPLRDHKEGFVRELYDLLEDPFEYKNIASLMPYPEAAKKLKTIAEQRVRTIYQENGIPTTYL